MNSVSTTISMGSANIAGMPKSCGLIQARAVTPMRGLSPNPLPAPTRVTSKVTGAVLPISVIWPSTLPLAASVWRKAVETKVASGKRGAFRNLSPASWLAKSFTLEVIDSIFTWTDKVERATAAGSHVSVPATRSKRKTL